MTTWTEHVPLELVNRVVARLMNSGPDGIILANEVNTLLGYSARRHAERELAADITANPRAVEAVNTIKTHLSDRYVDHDAEEIAWNIVLDLTERGWTP